VILFYGLSVPLIRYERGTLLVEELNPQVRIQWRMNRREMLRIAWRFFLAALRG
jgi:hypothetical protein